MLMRARPAATAPAPRGGLAAGPGPAPPPPPPRPPPQSPPAAAGSPAPRSSPSPSPPRSSAAPGPSCQKRFPRPPRPRLSPAFVPAPGRAGESRGNGARRRGARPERGLAGCSPRAPVSSPVPRSPRARSHPLPRVGREVCGGGSVSRGPRGEGRRGEAATSAAGGCQSGGAGEGGLFWALRKWEVAKAGSGRSDGKAAGQRRRRRLNAGFAAEEGATELRGGVGARCPPHRCPRHRPVIPETRKEARERGKGGGRKGRKKRGGGGGSV